MSVYLADQYSVQPITQLFQSIRLLEDFPECEEEVALMKKRLTTLLLNVPEKKLTRKVERLTYYPNGLCEMEDMTIILPPWENKNSAEDVKKEVDISGLKIINLLWYYQLKMHFNQKISISKANKIPAADLYAKHQTFSALSQEEKTYMNENELTHHTVIASRDMYKLLEKSYGSRTWDDEPIRSFHFLTKDELEKLSLYFRLKTRSSINIVNHYRLEEFIKKEILVESSQDTNRVVVSLEDVEFPPTLHYAYTSEFDAYKELFFTLYDRLNAIEDTTIRTILKRIGIVAKV